MANSNSFLRPYEILPIASGNKYLGENFIIQLYVKCTHHNRLIEAILHASYNFLYRTSKRYPNLSSFDSWPDAIINSQYLELPISRTNIHVPREIRGIQVKIVFVPFWKGIYSIRNAFAPRVDPFPERDWCAERQNGSQKLSPLWNMVVKSSGVSIYLKLKRTKRDFMQFADNAGLDQLAHSRRLIRALIVR